MTATTTRRLELLAGLLLAIVLLMAASASSAFAGAEWRLTSVHGPQNIPAGDGDIDTVEGQYLLQAYNIGDRGTVDDNGTPDDPGDDVAIPFTVLDTLPPGVAATDAFGGAWDCSATSFPTAPGGSVSCTFTEPLAAPAENALQRGLAPPLRIDVSVDPDLSGEADNTATVSGGGAPDASVTDPTTFSSSPAGFGFAPGSFLADLFDGRFPAGSQVRQAGSHPFELRVHFRTNLKLSHDPDDTDNGDLYYTEPEGHVKTVETRLPPGLIGNPDATAQCPSLLLNLNGPSNHGACPVSSQVGTVDLVLSQGKGLWSEAFFGVQGADDIPVFNMVPPRGALAAFAFAYVGNPAWILVELDPKDNYSVVARVENANEIYPPRGIELSFWGVPGDPAHDSLRQNSAAPFFLNALEAPFGAPIKPFLTLPAQCDRAGRIEQRMDSWQNPGEFTPWAAGAEIQATGCDDSRARFKPSIRVQPTSDEAASPTGLEIDLSVPQKDDTVENASNLYSGSGSDKAIATPPLRDIVTQLPAGMAINPSAANGLGGCTSAQIGLHTNDPVTCPDNSRIGSVMLSTPLLADPVAGSVYLADQSDNPFGSLLGLYVVISDPDLGLLVKLPAKVESDPETGRLTTTFTDNPQLPFDHLKLSLNSGPRAPLVNPPTCGTYSPTAHITSWNSSLPAVDTGDSFTLARGAGGRPCASTLAARPFAPDFDAKSVLPISGAFSPFAVDVSREDGSQELRSIETTLPAGMVGKLAGVSECPERVVASISAAPGTGLGEKLNPSCPSSSLIGHTDAAAGAGGLPFHNPGSVYLTGPRGGAPLSLAIVTPVLAGPFDLGSIVVRANLAVDPVTAQVHVTSDALPERIVADGNGIPLNIRSVRVLMDRDRFTLNPTSCDPMSVRGTIGSLLGATASVSDRFQVGACAALGFTPRLSLKLKGGTKRGQNPALRAALKMPKGGANIARTSVALPHSEFLAQDHIRTICTRVQFAADACPPGSIYGHARAFTPLLDEPLEGPVYLRSSNHRLPDLVASLDGRIHIELAGRIDSKDEGIRTTFESVPDAPVSKFVLTMKGGKRGLLENSRNICAHAARVTVQMDAHNGKVADSRPKLRNSCARKAGATP